MVFAIVGFAGFAGFSGFSGLTVFAFSRRFGWIAAFAGACEGFAGAMGARGFATALPRGAFAGCAGAAFTADLSGFADFALVVTGREGFAAVGVAGAAFSALVGVAFFAVGCTTVLAVFAVVAVFAVGCTTVLAVFALSVFAVFAVFAVFTGALAGAVFGAFAAMSAVMVLAVLGLGVAFAAGFAAADLPACAEAGCGVTGRGACFARANGLAALSA